MRKDLEIKTIYQMEMTPARQQLNDPQKEKEEEDEGAIDVYIANWDK